MKKLLRAAAIAVASTALVAGGAVSGAQAAPGDSATVTIQPVTLGTFIGKLSDEPSPHGSDVAAKPDLSDCNRLSQRGSQG
jgi:hypothetical protein